MQKTAVWPLFLSTVIRYIRRMSKDQRPDSSLSAEYALGLLRGGERSAVEGDAELRNEAEGWQKKLSPLDGGESEPVPSGSFEKILERIDETGIHLPGATKRAADAEWLQYSDGIVFRVLKVDEARGRQTLLVKMQPGALYKSHSHDIDEECLVIEGDLQYGDLVLRAGDYHLATPGALHPTGTTTAGCLLHVVVGMDI
jgi:quercetin dioxygenase-like cupin family protein